MELVKLSWSLCQLMWSCILYILNIITWPACMNHSSCKVSFPHLFCYVSPGVISFYSISISQVTGLRSKTSDTGAATWQWSAYGLTYAYKHFCCTGSEWRVWKVMSEKMTGLVKKNVIYIAGAGIALFLNNWMPSCIVSEWWQNSMTIAYSTTTNNVHL